LDKRFSHQFSTAHVGILLVGVLPVIMPLQRARDVAGVMTMSTAERLRDKEKGKVSPGKQRSMTSASNALVTLLT
jgi:hypothetical protein